MSIVDNLQKRPEPTIPNDLQDPPRFGQTVETTKDAFALELTKFFNRAEITQSRINEIPTIRKFDISLKPSESSHETAVKIIRKLPNIDENLPLVAILGATGRNLSMGIGGPYVTSVSPRVLVSTSLQEPFVLADKQTLKFRTITPDKQERTTTIIFRDSRFADITQATAAEVIKEINFQSLFARGIVNSDGGVDLSYGGPGDGGKVTGDIIVGDVSGDAGTAATGLGFIPGQTAIYTSVTPQNRYIKASYVDIGIEIVAEDDNVRTELTDLVESFFTFYVSERDYTFLGRSTFDNTIPNETYQVIIKPDPSMAGESEVPRPGGDEKDKLYVNRLNVPVTTMLYTDRSVITSSGAPFYRDSDDITFDPTIPQAN